MIVLKLTSGLGNQMFAYSYARALQEKYSEPIVFTTLGFLADEQRNYSLSHLKLGKNIKLLPYWKQLLFYAHRKLKYFFLTKIRYPNISNNGINSFKKMSKSGLYTTSDYYSFYPFIKSKSKIKYIDDGWQSEKYFKEINETIKTELRVITRPSEDNQKMILTLESCNSVCVHIRRGDYMSSKYHNVCNEQYYIKGMRIIADKVKNPFFYIFSNNGKDIKWIRENYKFEYPVKFVDLNNPDYEELRLMYSCKHFVISNSSFSWWGSYLSKNKNKVIVAPSRWFNGNKKTEDIYSDKWDIVKV